MGGLAFGLHFHFLAVDSIRTSYIHAILLLTSFLYHFEVLSQLLGPGQVAAQYGRRLVIFQYFLLLVVPPLVVSAN